MRRGPKIRDASGQWHSAPWQRADVRPMPFQREGIEWLWNHPRALLADEMGLGKGCQAIGVIDRMPAQSRTLIVVPAGLRLNWMRELSLWLTLPRRCVLARRYLPDAPVVVIHYDALPRLEAQLRAVRWDLVIVDEAHGIRHPWTTRARHVLGDEWTLPLEADRRILMTGSPIPNRPMELWPLLRWLGLEMDRNSFGHQFCGGKDYLGASDEAGLRELLGRYMLRRRKADVLTDLPPKSRQIVRIAPDGAARVAMDAEWALERQADGLEWAQKVGMAQMSRAREQTEAAKVAMPAVQALLREAVAQSGKIVVFGCNVATAKAVAAMFPGQAVSYCGADNAEARQRAVDQFQADLECQVFAGTIGAAGVGITLTAACRAIFLGEDWTPGLGDQAEDRIWRIGQKRPCLIQHAVLEGSVDARALEIQFSKQRVIDELMNRRAA